MEEGTIGVSRVTNKNMQEEKGLSVQKIRNEVELELSNPETLKTLVATTFKGLQPERA